MTDRPLIRLNPGFERRLKTGHPWAFSNEIRMSPDYRNFPKGIPVRLEGAEGWRFGTYMFNAHSLIAARLLDRDPAAVIDARWVRTRIEDAIALRQRLGLGTYHRLVHAEADRLPGLIIDRYHDVAVVQANTAGMDRLLPEITAALTGALGLRAVVVARGLDERDRLGERAAARGALAVQQGVRERGGRDRGGHAGVDRLGSGRRRAAGQAVAACALRICGSWGFHRPRFPRWSAGAMPPCGSSRTARPSGTGS